MVRMLYQLLHLHWHAPDTFGLGTVLHVFEEVEKGHFFPSVVVSHLKPGLVACGQAASSLTARGMPTQVIGSTPSPPPHNLLQSTHVTHPTRSMAKKPMHRICPPIRINFLLPFMDLLL
jgi:hypothetical protein